MRPVLPSLWDAGLAVLAGRDRAAALNSPDSRYISA